MKYLHQSIPLIKGIIYLFICFKLGFIFGTLISYILHKSQLFLLNKIFKIVPLSPQDMNFIWTEDYERYNLVTFLLFENFEPEKIKELLIERGIKNFAKLRSKIVFKFFEWYWEERPIEEAIERIEIIKNNDKYCFNSYDDITNFATTEIKQKFELLSELPFKILIIHNEKSNFKNLLMIKFDHSFTDGLGFIGLICALADNYSMDLFPKIHSKQKGFIDYIIVLLMIPYYVFYTFYRNFISLSTVNSLFKMNGKERNTGNVQLQITKDYDFNKISKICKSLNVTFNDMMMSILSSSIRKFCKENKLQIPNELSAAIPVGNRRLIKNITDVKITNDSTAVGCKITIVEDPIKDSHLIHKEFKKHVRNMPFIILTKFLTDFVFKYMPDYIGKLIVRNACRNFDFTISNVPGPKSPIYYANGKLNEFLAFTSPGFFSSFIGVFSYNGSFKFLFCFDEILNFKLDKFKNFIESEIENVLQNNDIKTS